MSGYRVKIDENFLTEDFGNTYIFIINITKIQSHIHLASFCNSIQQELLKRKPQHNYYKQNLFLYFKAEQYFVRKPIFQFPKKLSITKVEKTLNIFLNGRTKFKRSQNLSFLYATFPLESQTETFRAGLYIYPQITKTYFFVFILQRQYNSSTIFSNYFCLKARHHLREKAPHNKQELVPCCFLVLKIQTGHEDAMLMLKIFPYVRDIHTSTAVLPVQKGPVLIIPEYPNSVTINRKRPAFLCKLFLWYLAHLS